LVQELLQLLVEQAQEKLRFLVVLLIEQQMEVLEVAEAIIKIIRQSRWNHLPLERPVKEMLVVMATLVTHMLAAEAVVLVVLELLEAQ
jgi:hypothetical protein